MINFDFTRPIPVRLDIRLYFTLCTDYGVLGAVVPSPSPGGLKYHLVKMIILLNGFTDRSSQLMYEAGTLKEILINLEKAGRNLSRLFVIEDGCHGGFCHTW